jgi:hypothetical protein
MRIFQITSFSNNEEVLEGVQFADGSCVVRIPVQKLTLTFESFSYVEVYFRGFQVAWAVA